jgi:hypothetical protein
MAWDRALEALMPQTCSIIAPGTTRGFYGTLAASTVAATTYRCRWVEQREVMREAGGEYRAQRGVLWVASTGRISPTDRVTLPDGTTPPILAVEEYPDMDGLHHVKIRVGF